MLTQGDRVCVALSGGADSMCLLSLLNSLKDDLGIYVLAAHVNHGIRLNEADDDEAFVRDYCEKIGIELYVRFVDVPFEASISGESTELCARRLRYKFFEELDADVIATAHTGSDRIETLLMNLSRGASLDGLCSIPPVRGNIIRPLIGFTRNDIEHYCKVNCVPFVVDSTNLTNDYTRNKFRHEIVARLADIYPSFEHNALRCLELINLDNDELDFIAEELLFKALTDDNKLLCSELIMVSDALRRRIIVKYLNKNNIFDYAYKHICYVNDRLLNPFSVTLPSGIRVSGDSSRISISEFKKIDSVNKCEFYEFDKNDDIVYFSGNSEIKIYKSDNISDIDLNNCSYVDFDKVDDILRFRSREQGDIIHLGNRKCSKTLKKLFNEMKIPADKRDELAVLSDRDGLIYVELVGIDAKRSVDNNTKMFLIIEKKGC